MNKSFPTGILPLFVASLLATSLSTYGVSVVRTEVNSANGHVYHLLRGDDGRSGIDWFEAEAAAVGLGGHLVTINDADENGWIASTFPGDFATGADFYIWTGLNDARSEGTFEWASGEPVTYTNWYPGEPNNLDGIEDYAHIYNFNGLFSWNDLDGGTKNFGSFPMAALVEVSGVSPVPDSSIALVGNGFVLALLAAHRLLKKDSRK